MVSPHRNRAAKPCTIALVGKYVKLHDAYLSVMESLCATPAIDNERQGGDPTGWTPRDLTDENAACTSLADVDGIIVPGGFGDRGIEGMILAATVRPGEQRALPGHLPGHADRGHRVLPGTCCGITDANSGEFDPSTACTRSSTLCPTRSANINKGGTLRLGSYPCTHQARHQDDARATARTRSTSATATATSSTTTSARTMEAEGPGH